MPSYPTFLSLMWLFHNLIRYSSLSLSLSLHQHPQALSLFAIRYPHSFTSIVSPHHWINIIF